MYAAVPGALALAAGYLAPHTPRPAPPVVTNLPSMTMTQPPAGTRYGIPLAPIPPDASATNPPPIPLPPSVSGNQL